MPVSAKPSSDSKQSLATVGHTLLQAKGALAGLGKAFIDADSAIGKVATIFSALDESAQASLARALTGSKVKSIENGETVSVSAIRDTSGIIDNIIKGNLNEIRDSLFTLATIIKGPDGNPALADLGKALSDAGGALAKVSTLIDGLSDSARTDLDRAFAGAGFAKADTDGGKADGSKADGSKADGSKADGGKADGGKADGGKADGSKADGSKADGGSVKVGSKGLHYSANDTQDDASATPPLIGNYGDSYGDSGFGSAGIDFGHNFI